MNIRNKTFANNLRRERINKGFTQKTMGLELEISRKRYASWEECRGTPNIYYLSRLCEVLEVDDLYLFISKELVES